MKVLLTGSTGFVGRHVLRHLLLSGLEVIVVGRERPPDFPASVQFICRDLLEPDGDGRLDDCGATHLIHLAWYAEHGKYWHSMLNPIWSAASVRLVDAFCEQGGKHVLMAGTGAEYALGYELCDEVQTPREPQTLYGSAKLATQHMAQAVCDRRGVALCWTRFFIPFGPGESRKRLIPSIVDTLLESRRVLKVNGHQQRDFLPVDDVARAVVYLSVSDAVGSINVSSGVPSRISDLARQIGSAIGRDTSRIEYVGYRPDRAEPDIFVGDSSRIRALGWQPHHDRMQYLAAYARQLACHDNHKANDR